MAAAPIWILVYAFPGVTALGIGWVLISALTSAVPLRYNVRNVLVRWRSTVATMIGIALVVLVYVLLQSLVVGIEKSSATQATPGTSWSCARGQPRSRARS